MSPFLSMFFINPLLGTLDGYSFSKQRNLDSSKVKESADDTYKFDENGIKFSKRVENTVEKGEIARNEQFLPFPQCFQNTCTANT